MQLLPVQRQELDSFGLVTLSPEIRNMWFLLVVLHALPGPQVKSFARALETQHNPTFLADPKHRSVWLPLYAHGAVIKDGKEFYSLSTPIPSKDYAYFGFHLTPRDLYQSFQKSGNTLLFCDAFTRLVYDALVLGYGIEFTESEVIVFVVHKVSGVVSARVLGALEKVPATRNKKRFSLLEAFRRIQPSAFMKQVNTKTNQKTSSNSVYPRLQELKVIYRDLGIPTKAIDVMIDVAKTTIKDINPAFTIHSHLSLEGNVVKQPPRPNSIGNRKSVLPQNQSKSLINIVNNAPSVVPTIRNARQKPIALAKLVNETEKNDTAQGAVQNNTNNVAKEINKIVANHQNNNNNNTPKRIADLKTRPGKNSGIGSLVRFPKIRGFTFAPMKNWVGRKH